MSEEKFIIVDSLSYIYSKDTPYETQALKNISFDIKKGEIIGIIGHTGCGKSTLVQHLNGLIRPMSGKVFVDGLDLSDKSLNLKKLRCKVGLVFQYPEYQLFEETVFDDVAFGPRKAGFREEDTLNSVKESLVLLGFNFEQVKNRSPFSLSGGEMRRVAIAGVLAMKPNVLILDEPTAGLDPNTKEILISKLLYLNRHGITIILVSHSMDDVAEIADRLLVLHEGEVLAFGRPKEVFSDSSVLALSDLMLPQCTKLLICLKENGIDINTNFFKVDETADEIARVIKK